MEQCIFILRHLLATETWKIWCETRILVSIGSLYVQHTHQQTGSDFVDRLIIDSLVCDLLDLLWRGLSNLNWRWTCLSLQTMVQLSGLQSKNFDFHLLESSPVLPPVQLPVLPSSAFIIRNGRSSRSPKTAPFVSLCDSRHSRSSPPVLLHMLSSAAMAACCTRRDMHAGGEDRQNQPIRSAGRQFAVHFYQSLSMDDKLAPMRGTWHPSNISNSKTKMALQQAFLFIDNLFRCYATS